MAFVMSAYPGSGLTREAVVWIFGIAAVFLVLDIIEYLRKFNR